MFWCCYINMTSTFLGFVDLTENLQGNLSKDMLLIFSQKLRKCLQCSSLSLGFQHMWCVARFGISHYLAFAWTFERMRMHANAFFYLHVVFIRLHELAFKRVYQMSNVWMPFKRVNTSNLMTFECCFLISWYHEN